MLRKHKSLLVRAPILGLVVCMYLRPGFETYDTKKTKHRQTIHTKRITSGHSYQANKHSPDMAQTQTDKRKKKQILKNVCLVYSMCGFFTGRRGVAPGVGHSPDFYGCRDLKQTMKTYPLIFTGSYRFHILDMYSQ